MTDRKTGQVCAAVERVVSALLASDLEDERLNQLTVVAVQPAPNVARIRVICVARDDVGTAYDALPGATSYIRQEVARSLQRRRAPELEFVVLPNGAYRDA